jgi:hypothetical protein
LRSQITSHYDKLKDSIEEHRREVLRPDLTKRDTDITVARAHLDEVLKNHPSDLSAEHRRAVEDYNAIKEICDADYRRKVADIDAKYNFKGRIDTTERERKTALAELEGRETNQLANIFNAVVDFTKRARDAWNNQNYQGFNLNQYAYTWQLPQQPAAPVYYQQPVYQQPVQQPVYQQPVQQPVYQQPVQVMQPPVYYVQQPMMQYYPVQA